MTRPLFRTSHLPLFLGAAIMMLLAWYDNYPIVTSDSGTYISCAFNGTIPTDRPVFYSWFIRLTSLGQTLWLPVYVQSLLLSWLLIRLVRRFNPDICNRHLIALFLLFSLGTIGGWYSSQLMPDIFTPVLGLALLLYLTDQVNPRNTWCYGLLILLASVMHNAHPIILTLFTALLFIWRICNTRLSIRFRQITVLAGLSLCSWLALCTVNFNAGYGFRPSKSTSVFLMGKMVESGILKQYLDQECNVHQYKICAYKDSLPVVAFSFVWDGNSPFYKTGGWNANEQEYNQIIKDIASSPRYWPILAFKSMEATARQLTQINIDESYALPWITFGPGSSPYESIRQYVPHEMNTFHTSRQNEKTLSVQTFDKVYALIFLLSTIIVLLGYKKLPAGAGLVYILLILFVVLNAFSTATFANILPRLNSRTIWLLPACNLLMIYTIARQAMDKKHS